MKIPTAQPPIVISDAQSKSTWTELSLVLDSITRRGERGQNTEVSVHLGPQIGRRGKKSPPKEIVDKYFRTPGIFYDPFVQMYFRDVASRIFDRDERAKLIDQAKKGDNVAKEKFIEANLRLVVWIAKKYAYYGCHGQMQEHFLDLVQEGNLALVRAYERFDIERGRQFSTRSVWDIHGRISGYLTKLSRTTPQAHFLLHTVERLLQDLQHNPTIEEIMQVVSPTDGFKTVHELITKHQRPISLDIPILREEDPLLVNEPKDYSLGDLIEDRRAVMTAETIVDQALRLKKIEEVLKMISFREREVVKLKLGFSDGLEHTKSLSR